MRYGVSFSVEQIDFAGRLRYVGATVLDWIRTVRLSLQMLLTGQAGLADMSGPVGIVQQMGQQASAAASWKEAALEEAEHAAKFAELLGDCVWDTKTNLDKRMNAEAEANSDKYRIAKRAKELNLDAIHDTVHEMAKDEARHGKGFEGLFNRYFKK